MIRSRFQDALLQIDGVVYPGCSETFLKEDNCNANTRSFGSKGSGHLKGVPSVEVEHKIYTTSDFTSGKYENVEVALRVGKTEFSLLASQVDFQQTGNHDVFTHYDVAVKGHQLRVRRV